MTVRTDSADAVRRLLKGVALDTNIRDRTGRTPLMWAAIRGDAGMILELWRKGADLALTDKEGKTALEHAREHGHDEIAAMLTPDALNTMIPADVKPMAFMEFVIDSIRPQREERSDLLSKMISIPIAIGIILVWFLMIMWITRFSGYEIVYLAVGIAILIVEYGYHGWRYWQYRKQFFNRSADTDESESPE